MFFEKLFFCFEEKIATLRKGLPWNGNRLVILAPDTTTVRPVKCTLTVLILTLLGTDTVW